MSTLCRANSRRFPTGPSWIASLALASALCASPATAQVVIDAATSAPVAPPALGFRLGGWGGDGLVDTRNGRFIACGAAARFRPDVTIEFAVDRLSDLTMQMSSPRWFVGDGTGYEVHVGVDKMLAARAVRRNKLSFSFGNDDEIIAALFQGPWLAAVLPDGYNQFHVGDGLALVDALRNCVRDGMAWEASLDRETAPIVAAQDAHWCAAPPVARAIPGFAGAPIEGGPAIAERAGVAALFRFAALDAPSPTPDNVRRRDFPDARRAWVSRQTFGALQIAAPGDRPITALSAADVDLGAFGCADGDVDLLLQTERPLGAMARFALTCRAPADATRFVTLVGDDAQIAMIQHCAESERFDEPFAIDEAVGAALLRGLSGWGR